MIFLSTEFASLYDSFELPFLMFFCCFSFTFLCLFAASFFNVFLVIVLFNSGPYMEPTWHPNGAKMYQKYIKNKPACVLSFGYCLDPLSTLSRIAPSPFGFIFKVFSDEFWRIICLTVWCSFAWVTASAAAYLFVKSFKCIIHILYYSIYIYIYIYTLYYIILYM